ncbi:MAG: aminoglycoside phosphotransferase family protein [Vicinamibacterales bacterium]
MTHTSSTTPDISSRIQQFLAGMGLGAGTRVTPLTPDASDRRYFRAEADGVAPVVLAVHPGPIVFDEMPFSDAHALLAAMPVPVPAVLGHDDALGIIALGDLGNVTLQAHLRGVDEDERRRRYEEAVGHIVTLQTRGRELAPSNRLPYRLAFDVEKLMFELRFFREHFLEGWRGARLAPEEHATLEGEFLAIATELAAEPRVVCHRDYHSRNLMVLRGELFLIDYQDARMGPDTYDLASLLRDSYVDLPERLVDALIDTFLCATRPDPDAARAEFVRRFDLMSVQRNLKALGTFGFQAGRGNHSYVADMPRTLGHVRRNLATYPRFDALSRVLARHVPELA